MPRISRISHLPPLDAHEAQVAADRGYFCHDAPCTEACPTSIDVPLFIRQIMTGTPEAAAKTILSQNILGGMCARGCPTGGRRPRASRLRSVHLLCHATGTMMAKQSHPFTRGAAAEKTAAVVGGGSPVYSGWR